MPAKKAAADLVGHLQAIAKQQKESDDDQPWLVTIALDGENCWEFYPHDGKDFLETLYESLSNQSNIKLVTVSEFIDQFPPTTTIPSEQLHSGSWVDGNFTTWIGDPVKNRAWDYLTAARQVLVNHPEATEENNPAAWEALYAAEGSDWFWWFGEGHSSNQDAIFDQLFREHLHGIYTALNEPVPPYLHSPLEIHEARSEHKPEGFIHPIIDGKGDEQDWDKAGRIEVGGARGTMHNSSTIQRIWYGVDHLNFYVRVDFKTGAVPGQDIPPDLHLFWYYPDRTMVNSSIPLAEVPDTAPLNYLFHHHLEVNLLSQSVQFRAAGDNYLWYPRATRAQVALDSCLEIAIPWADLQVPPDYPLRLILVLSDDGCFSGYVPENGLIPIDVP
jgi:alpha-amylase/alpha-mannosidase (GH57 family)